MYTVPLNLRTYRDPTNNPPKATQEAQPQRLNPNGPSGRTLTAPTPTAQLQPQHAGGGARCRPTTPSSCSWRRWRQGCAPPAPSSPQCCPPPPSARSNSRRAAALAPAPAPAHPALAAPQAARGRLQLQWEAVWELRRLAVQGGRARVGRGRAHRGRPVLPVLVWRRGAAAPACRLARRRQCRRRCCGSGSCSTSSTSSRRGRHRRAACSRRGSLRSSRVWCGSARGRMAPARQPPLAPPWGPLGLVPWALPLLTVASRGPQRASP